MLKLNIYFQDNCEDADNNVTYFDSLAFLQTVAFTIGYGHITPTCHAGRVKNTVIKFNIRSYDYKISNVSSNLQIR